MRLVFALVLFIGIGLAGGAVYMAQDYISQYQTALANERAASKSRVPLTEIYVADTKLGYGNTLTRDMVRRVPWPEPAMPEGAFLEEAALFPEDGEARQVLRAMEANEAVLAVKVTEPGGEAGIGSRLSEGMRAFTIEVDVVSGVSGFLRPNDRVDIYWTGDSQGKDVTKLIDTGVRIIAVDQSANADTAKVNIAQTVTVEVSPQQVAAFAQAQSTGQLSLSLVGSADDSIAEAVEVDQKRLLGIEEQEVVEAEAPAKVCTVKTRRGSESVEIPVPCPH